MTQQKYFSLDYPFRSTCSLIAENFTQARYNNCESLFAQIWLLPTFSCAFPTISPFDLHVFCHSNLPKTMFNVRRTSLAKSWTRFKSPFSRAKQYLICALLSTVLFYYLLYPSPQPWECVFHASPTWFSKKKWRKRKRRLRIGIRACEHGSESRAPRFQLWVSDYTRRQFLPIVISFEVFTFGLPSESVLSRRGRDIFVLFCFYLLFSSLNRSHLSLTHLRTPTCKHHIPEHYHLHITTVSSILVKSSRHKAAHASSWQPPLLNRISFLKFEIQLTAASITPISLVLMALSWSEGSHTCLKLLAQFPRQQFPLQPSQHQSSRWLHLSLYCFHTTPWMFHTSINYQQVILGQLLLCEFPRVPELC